MADLITDYKQLTGLELPEMHVGGYRREEPRYFNTSQEALDHLRNARPTCGWLLFQSWQGAFSEGLPALDDTWGNLLAAEAVLENGDCVIVEHRSSGGWRILHLQHDDEADGLWDRVEYLSRQPADGKLVYRRYWDTNATHGAMQVGAILETIEPKPRGS